MFSAQCTISARAWAVTVLTAIMSLGAAGSTSALFKDGGRYYFQSPSRNINCEGHRKAVYCVIYSRIQMVTFTRSGRFKVSALRTNPSWKARILRYESSVSFYGFRCSSRRTGMVCVRRSTGHGVLMSRSGAKPV